MPRYFTQPRADYYDDPATLGNTITVHETDNGPAKTGLLDQHGNDIFRSSDRIRMGFDTTKRTAQSKDTKPWPRKQPGAHRRSPKA